MPRMLLVRHAQSRWNVDGRWQGHADPPLSDTGAQQARSVAGRLGSFDEVVSSDLERARATAAHLVPGATPAIEGDLREYDVGAWSGRTRTEIEAEWPAELALFDAGRLEAPPGGERRADFETRVRDALSRLAGSWAAREADRVLVVTHGGVIRTLARLEGWPEARVSHLCGYEAEIRAGDKGATLALLSSVDLLDGPVTRPGRDGELAY